MTAAASFPDHIAALLRPEAYAHPVDEIELIQTHISWVLLAGAYVYKVKKPLDLGFLDFTTLARRRSACRQEVMLNRRLCHDTYLGVVALRELDGAYRFDGPGRIMDYAVTMRRLPQEHMLDQILTAGTATPEMLDAVAEKIAAFHRRSTTSATIARFGSIATIRRNWDENFEQTAPFVGDTIRDAQYAFLRAYVRAILRRKREDFEQRRREGRVRDCHGDLRASAVCFVTDADICIYDCIEFNRRFRYSDVASEVAFLAMDLESLGHPELSWRFVDRYCRVAGDPGLFEVLDFYRCYRAYVRGKVDSFRAVEPEVDPGERERARLAARRRFALAVSFAARDRPPVLLIMCGLSGSGKSVVAGELAADLGLTRISSDDVRKVRAGLRPTERRRESFQAGLYAPSVTDATYREMLRRAGEQLRAGASVVLDATFSHQRWRRLARNLADDAGALFLCVECRADETEIRRRLLVREQDDTAVSDATWDIYLAQRAAFEPVVELSDWEHIVLHTTGSLSRILAGARAKVAERLLPSSSPPADGT
jgi:aminoglycoside phosphotransferase family enzyme/predicted kinase